MTVDDVAAEVARSFASHCRAAVEERGRFACAIPGGSVSDRVLPHVAALDLPWQAVDLFWVDERFVPVTSPDSNLGGAKRRWLDGLPPPGPRVHGMAAGDRTPEETAAAAESDLIETLGRPSRLDLAILGVGPDGHVASLFPGHPALEIADRLVAVVRDAPKPPPLRLTLTVNALAAAREIWIVAFGKEKADVLRNARTDPASRLPVAIVARSGPVVRWFLDDGAGNPGSRG